MSTYQYRTDAVHGTVTAPIKSICAVETPDGWMARIRLTDGTALYAGGTAENGHRWTLAEVQALIRNDRRNVVGGELCNPVMRHPLTGQPTVAMYAPRT